VGREEGRSSFLKKRTKKLLLLRLPNDTGQAWIVEQAPGIKVFLLLFLQKKKILPYIKN
jgi:hypothetical protein